MGALSFVQRFDSAIRLNVHVHTLALDGVYVRDEQTGELGFHPLPEPTAEQVTAVAQRTYERVKTILRRANRPLLDDHGAHDDDESFGVDHPVLAACYGRHVPGRMVPRERAIDLLVGSINPAGKIERKFFWR